MSSKSWPVVRARAVTQATGSFNGDRVPSATSRGPHQLEVWRVTASQLRWLHVWNNKLRCWASKSRLIHTMAHAHVDSSDVAAFNIRLATSSAGLQSGRKAHMLRSVAHKPLRSARSTWLPSLAPFTSTYTPQERIGCKDTCGHAIASKGRAAKERPVLVEPLWDSHAAIF